MVLIFSNMNCMKLDWSELNLMVCAYARARVCVCVSESEWVGERIILHMVCTYVHTTSTRLSILTHLLTHSLTHSFTHLLIHTRPHTCLFSHTHTHTHTHTHARARARARTHNKIQFQLFKLNVVHIRMNYNHSNFS